MILFTVNSGYRGHNIGCKLLSGLFEYFESQNTQCIYLYTDTACSYEFYEYKGFKRLEDKGLKLLKDGKPFGMRVFLYEYFFPNCK